MGVPSELGSLSSGNLGQGAVTLLVPLGSIEQHGPHLPLDTDIRIATAVAGAAAEGLGAATLVAPPLSYGASGEHRGFAGTISIGTEALTVVLVEYGRSACEWAKRLVFVNGHGGNLDALQAAVCLLRTEGRDVAWWSCSVDGGDAHAGHTETSVLLHLSPDEVQKGEIRPGNTEPLGEILPRLRAGGVSAVSASGVLGDPTTATAEAGERIFDEMVLHCVARINRWQPATGGMLT
ncbi:MAG: mycofactocin biosynthesis peptidyl-dipeptidase MftE [Mycobacterium sp.]